MIQPPHDIFKSHAAARQVKCATTHSIRSRRVFNDESRWCGFRSVAAISPRTFQPAGRESDFRVELAHSLCHSQATLPKQPGPSNLAQTTLAAMLRPYKVGAPAERLGAASPLIPSEAARDRGQMSRSPMVVRTVPALRRAVEALRTRKAAVALVPTMGALHDGHVSLVRLAKRRAQKVIFSIFVNPTQFAPTEDFGSYPRTWKADLAKLAAEDVDIVWHPGADAMYPQG